MNRSLFFLALAMIAGVAVAQTASVSGNPDAGRDQMHAGYEARFNESDANHDGKISFAEMQTSAQRRLKERFEKLDADHDGGISMQEMRQAHRQRRGEMREHRDEHRQAMREKMQALDANHDQALSRQEIGTALPKLSENFDRIDANHDGKLSREEMRAMHRMHRADDQKEATPANP